MKQCVTCLQWKEETEFNWRYKTLGIRHPTCRKCHKPFRKTWYESNKERHLKQVKDRKHEARTVAREYVFDYLSTHPCIECGEADPRVLEFHHRHDKDMGVSVMVAGGYPVATIQAEIEKCDVLCANCHRKVTHTERGWFRGRKKHSLK
ncbi:MAG TPA: hypothetical protein VFY83_17570 [Anaerolineales bacterium]|nr:hypothetical protein [Anaerolineales bacterium]